MNKKGLLQIGELSKICSVSVQALRYYEKINLVKPSYIDDQTGYRYYLEEDIFLLRNVTMLKSAGFTLKEILIFLNKKSINDIESLYRDKINSFDEEIKNIQNQKEEISCYLDFITALKDKKYDFNIEDVGKIFVKEMKEDYVVYVRDTILFNYPSLMFLYNQLLKKVFKNNIRVDKNLYSIFHGNYENLYHKQCDIELNLIITNEFKLNEDCIKKRKGATVISCLHQGKYPSSIPVFNRMKKYAYDFGYKINGDPMHKLVVPIAAVKTTNEMVIEIIQPVLKIH